MKIYNTILFISTVIFYFISPTASCQVITIENKSLDLENSEYYISNVIDCRNEINDSDLSERNLSISSSQIHFDARLAQSILELFRSSTKDTLGKTPVTIKINWFKFEKAEFDLFLGSNFEFYTKQNGTFYYEFMAGNNMDIEYSTELNNNAAEIAVSLIKISHNEFTHRMENNLGYHIKVEEFALLHNSLPIPASQKKISTGSKNGIYYTFNNFRDNIADTTSKIKKASTVEGGMLFKGDGKFINNAWAISYENDLYLTYKEHSVPLEKSKNGYIINQKITHKTSGSSKQGAIVGLIVTGAASLILLISSGAILTPIANALGILVGMGIGALIPQYEVKEVFSQIDMITGRIVPISDFYKHDFTSKGFKEKKIVFYISQKNVGDLNLIIDSLDIVKLKKSSYYEYKVKSGTNSVSFCLKSNSDEYCGEVDISGINNFSFDIFLKKDGTIKCTEILDHIKISKYERWIGRGMLKKIAN